MGPVVLLVVILGGMVLIFIISSISANKKLKLKIINDFGKESTNQDYDIDGISEYHSCMDTGENNARWIDRITWNDLDMDSVFKRINACNTSVKTRSIADKKCNKATPFYEF